MPATPPPDDEATDAPTATAPQVAAPPAGDGADADIPGLGYEEARDELVAIVARLESGQVGLEESMTLWRRGDALAAHCAAWLDAAEQTLAAGDPTA